MRKDMTFLERIAHFLPEPPEESEQLDSISELLFVILVFSVYFVLL